MKNRNTNNGNGPQLNIGENSNIVFNSSTSNQDQSFWSKLLRLPWIIKLFLILLIIVIIVGGFVLLNKGYTVETPVLKIIPPTKDSIIVSKSSVPESRNQNRKVGSNEKTYANKTTNINSGNGTQINIMKNEGIVANNSTINVNAESPPRNLKDPQLQKDLEIFINNMMRAHNRDKSCAIKVRVDHTSLEARNFAKEIFDYLKIKNYNVQGIVNLEIFSPEIIQNEIVYDKVALYEDEDSTIHIKIGLNKTQ